MAKTSVTLLTCASPVLATDTHSPLALAAGDESPDLPAAATLSRDCPAADSAASLSPDHPAADSAATLLPDCPAAAARPPRTSCMISLDSSANSTSNPPAASDLVRPPISIF